MRKKEAGAVDKKILVWAAVVVGLMVAASPAMASTGAAMPWDTAITNIQSNLSGTVAKTAGMAAIAITGLMWMFTEHGTGLRRVSQIAFGLAVAVEGAAFMGNLGLSGASLF